MRLGEKVNLVVCQKSKIDDWFFHFHNHYDNICVYDLTDKKQLSDFYMWSYGSSTDDRIKIGVINYEVLFRRPKLAQFKNFTLMLDESSLITNENAKRSKFILNKLQPKNIILLSGTPTNGKYEQLWSQLHLLGWKISKELYWKQYVDVEYIDTDEGFPVKVVRGYKNVERLKSKMREYGCRFLKTEDVFDLPCQTFNTLRIETPKHYNKFIKTGLTTIDGREFVGDTILTKSLYARMICGSYSTEKMETLKDILQSTEDRVVVFYNFNDELNRIEDLCIELDKPVSIINGQTKDLKCYEEFDNAVTLVQYQAGAMGLNLQKANKIIYFTLPWGKGSCGLWEQSKKRIHRIGQNRPCFYYTLICSNTIEETNLTALQQGKELTDELFREVKE